MLNYIEAHRILLLCIIWVTLLAVFYIAWRYRTSREYRHMSVLQILSINLMFFISAGYVVQLHHHYVPAAIAVWVVAYIIVGIVFFRKTMRMTIDYDTKTDLIRVPMFFFLIVFYVYIPYILTFLSLLAWNRHIYNNLSFIIFIMFFKGCIAGIYIGFSIAALYQVYDQEGPGPKIR